ncbi:MAG: response regulator [Dehalococcoidales bacterium]|nr:response regulator [Dehalococcoidales bacterium]
MGNKTGKKTVLIVDDEEHVRSLLSRILSNSYNIIEAGDGKLAVDLTHSQHPDIILMDIMMPRMNGDVACHIIKSNPLTSNIPVIMITALDHDLNRKLSLDIMGANEYITKPFETQALMETINKLLANK